MDEKKIPSAEEKDNTDIGAPPGPQPLPWPSSFREAEDGIYKIEVDDEGNMSPPRWVFSPLRIEALTRDVDDQNWGLLLSVRTPSGTWHKWSMPMQLTGGNGNAYREILLSLGLRLAPGAQKHLHAYLITAQPARMARCVSRIGWHGGVYVLPDRTYGRTEEESVILQTVSADSLFRVRGTLPDWQKHIAALCLGNSRLIFGVCAAFAAALLKPCGLEGGGFHFMGNSSSGKSTLLLVAGSVCGGGGENGFLRRWRATDNALEAVALAHNDNLLCIDEIGQVAARVAAETAYMLANGQGKARAAKDGTSRPLPEWRLLFLSNGELSLEQKLQEENRRMMAGQAVRVISIPADAGTGHGVFEKLHGFPDGKALSEHLQKAACLYYGSPLRAFLETLTADTAAHRNTVQTALLRFEQEICLSEADGQVRRAARRFALVAAAGELAIQFGLLNWPTGTAVAASRRCLRDWIAYRGGLGASEAREAVGRVREFIAVHGASRFEGLHQTEERIPNRAGYRKQSEGMTEYLIYPAVFRKEICLGGDSKAIAKYLAEAGFLEAGENGKLAKVHKLPREGVSSARMYTIRASILEGDID